MLSTTCFARHNTAEFETNTDRNTNNTNTNTNTITNTNTNKNANAHANTCSQPPALLITTQHDLEQIQIQIGTQAQIGAPMHIQVQM